MLLKFGKVISFLYICGIINQKNTIMKKTLATLVLYIYNKYIHEDWNDFTKFGKICIYPFWLIRILYITVASQVLVLGYYWENSTMYPIVQQARLESMVMMDQMMAEFNKK